MTTITVDIENRSGTRQGSGPILSCTSLEYERVLSRAGRFTAMFPKADSQVDNINPIQSVLRFYLDGSETFAGIVERTQTTIDNAGNILFQVEGRDLLAELAEAPVGLLEVNLLRLDIDSGGLSFSLNETVTGGTSGATGTVDTLASTTVHVLAHSVTGSFQVGEEITGSISAATADIQNVRGLPWEIVNAANSILNPDWSLDTNAPGWEYTVNQDLIARFAGESALDALVMLSQNTGEHFRLDSGATRTVEWLQTSTPASGVRAIQGAGEPKRAEGNNTVCFIQSLREIQDSYELVNRVYPYGAGNGQVRVDLAATDRTASGDYTLSTANNYIENGTSISNLGVTRAKYVQFRNIAPIENTDGDWTAAANALYDAAYSWLQQRDTVADTQFFELSVIKLPAAVEVGETIQVIYADDRYNLDSTFVVLGILNRVSGDGSRVSALTIGTVARHPDDEVSILVDEIKDSRIYEAHPQPAPNVWTMSYSKPVYDDGGTNYDASLRFRLGTEVVKVQQIVLEFEAQGGSTTSSMLNLESTVSSTSNAAESSHTHTVPNHQHNITVNESGSAWGDAGVTAPSGGISFMVHNAGGGGSIDVQTNSDSGSTTSAAGSSHNHTITTTYGIFREADANTFQVGDMDYSTNGGAGWTSIVAGDRIGSTNWWRVDLTSALIGSDGRPNNENNEVLIRGIKSGTRVGCQFDAQITVRAVVQAVSYD